MTNAPRISTLDQLLLLTQTYLLQNFGETLCYSALNTR